MRGAQDPIALTDMPLRPAFARPVREMRTEGPAHEMGREIGGFAAASLGYRDVDLLERGETGLVELSPLLARPCRTWQCG